MRLINADELINKQYRIDDSATLSTRDVVNIEDIEDALTIQAIPIDVLDKIREEIEMSIYHTINIDGKLFIRLSKVNEIIDKQIGEE